MKYVRINDHNYVLVDDKPTGKQIVQAAHRQLRRAKSLTVLLGHNCNGSMRLVLPDDVPWQYDFDLYEDTSGRKVKNESY